MLFSSRRRSHLIPVAVLSCVILITIYETSKVQGFGAYLGEWARDGFSWDTSLTRGSSTNTTVAETSNPAVIDMSAMYSILLSTSTPDQKLFPINFGDFQAINPNIIPHPKLQDTWVVTAQQLQESSPDFKSVEISCNAAFSDSALRCIDQPAALPISATFGPHCRDDLAHLAFNVGPHDARVFYGPTMPYTIYGSNSGHTCFGQWIQDFRTLANWDGESGDWEFRTPTDLQRPAPYHPIEKNWFPFWDHEGHIYIHHEIYPRRVFAKLNLDGSVGPDIAPLASTNDQSCMAKYMPKVKEEMESIHQATNSLLITLCKRTDPGCHPDNTNTFIMTIFQHKAFYSYHSVYEPYLMLFSQQSPFEIHAISKKPFWINGRGKPGEKRPSYLPLRPTDPWNQTEMLYVTSMSWKSQGLTYHGYADDKLFLAFGIEDQQTAAIDIIADDLMQDLGPCAFA